jgi:hypothetical protein
METMIIVVAVLAVALVGGYFLATHVHNVATAITRATTIPSSDVAVLNAKIAGLGTQLNASTQAIGAHVTATVAAAVPASAATLPPAPAAPAATV